MVIYVTKNVRVRAEDSRNYVLEHRRVAGDRREVSEPGKERWVVLGYYGHLSAALASLVDKRADVLVDSRTGVVSARLRLKVGEVLRAIKGAHAEVLARVGELEAAAKAAGGGSDE